MTDTAGGATVYDEHVEHYLQFVDAALAAEPSLFRSMLDILAGLVGPRLPGAIVLDVACGEGYVSRSFAELGARSVVGIDLSSSLVDVARSRTDAPSVSYRVDDARTLESVADGSVDIAVSQMAMMDIADHEAAFASVRRVLQDDGVFAFSLLHPCFETPYSWPEERPPTDDEGVPIACVVRRYATEGHWMSGGTGVRGRMGSHHRMLSTYLNDLIAAGFTLERLVEPVFDVPGIFAEVPRVLIVSASPR